MYRILMVCTGNICRSVSAERMLRARLASEGLDERVRVDSVGISDEEQGNPIYPDTAAVLASRGIDVAGHAARQVDPAELGEQDLILAMTRQHAAALRRLPGGSEAPIELYRSHDPAARAAAESGGERELDMADPWYGGPAEHTTMVDEVEAGLDELVQRIRAAVA